MDFLAWAQHYIDQLDPLSATPHDPDKAYAPKAAEGNFSFMRTNAAYKRSMEFASKRWRWVEKRLNK